jgi:hypothetical protein
MTRKAGSGLNDSRIHNKALKRADQSSKLKAVFIFKLLVDASESKSDSQ